jgi:hypothetical protein
VLRRVQGGDGDGCLAFEFISQSAASISHALLPSQIGSPFKIASSTGTLSQGAFNWVSIDLTGNAFGTLTPGTRYWVGLLPGSKYSPPADSVVTRGIQWGGVVDATTSGPLSSNGKLYTAQELGSQNSATDAANGCAKPKALAFLKLASNWASLSTGTYERFSSPAWDSAVGIIRHGAVLYGNAV